MGAQIPIVMFNWECPETELNGKQLRLEIIFTATKSDITCKHTCNDLTLNFFDANSGFLYATSNECVTIIDEKPLIVGEKVGSFSIKDNNLFMVILENNVATIKTTIIKDLFWKVDYDKLPNENFEEVVASRNTTQEEIKLFLTDLLMNFTFVMETGPITITYQEMRTHKPTVATKSLTTEKIELGGVAQSEKDTSLSYGLASSNNYERMWQESSQNRARITADDRVGFSTIKININNQEIKMDSFTNYSGFPRQGLYSVNKNKRKLMVMSTQAAGINKNTVRSGKNFSVMQKIPEITVAYLNQPTVSDTESLVNAVKSARFLFGNEPYIA